MFNLSRLVTCLNLTLTDTEEAQSPDAGVNTYFFVPVDAVLIVEGHQVPEIPLFDVAGNAGAFVPVHSVGMLAKVGVTLAATDTFSVPEDALQPLLLATVTDIVSDDGAVCLMLLVPLHI